MFRSSIASLFVFVAIAGGCNKSASNQTYDTGGSKGTFTFAYSNHQWNGYTLEFGDTKIAIDTPQGDDADPQRNISFGFRPKLILNRFSYEQGSTVATNAIWIETATGVSLGDQIYCKRVASLVDLEKAKFPLKASEFFSAFGIAAQNNASTCDFSVAKPGERPGWQPGTVAPRDDEVCMFSPKAITGKGPELVTLLAPRRLLKTQISMGQYQWPERTLSLCVDGKRFDLVDALPPDSSPDPSPTPGETPFVKELKSVAAFEKLARDVQTIKGVKYLFDRKENKDPIYFQNTRIYEYHLPFLNEHIKRFQGRLTAQEYEAMLYAPMPKEITGGELYWSPNGSMPGGSGKGVLGFSTYYREKMDLEEVRTTYEQIKQSAPFAAKKTVFVFENNADFFKNRNALMSAGIPSLPINALMSAAGR